MHIYRYRPSSLLSQKGLLYDEWYFASKEELNDPIDMQSNFQLSFSASDWVRTLTKLWKDAQYAKVTAAYLSKLSPISYELFINDFELHEKIITQQVFQTQQFTLGALAKLQESLAHLFAFLKLYGPGSGYSISFSRTNTDMLMWSHYALSHTGFCLIYRPINNSLSQCPKRKKDSLSVSRQHVASIPKAFNVEDINYSDELHPLDASALLPAGYTNYNFETDELRLSWYKSVRAQLLTKNECWRYEQECRLVLPQPSRWISGNVTYKSLQRLFYYDFNQVVGVIFGARMSENDKDMIRDIINHKIKLKFKNANNPNEKRYIFDFLYQQAKICSTSRKVQVIDLELIVMGTELKDGGQFYTDRLEKWKKGEGMTLENGSFGYEDIP